MRCAALVLPDLHLEIACQRERASGGVRLAAPNACTVVVLGAPGFTERDVLGGTRVGAVNAAAYREGIRVGQTIAAARAKRSDFSVRVVSPAEIEKTLERLAEAAMPFGATVSFAQRSESSISCPCVWVDATGCARLFAATPEAGERVLLERLAETVSSLGHRVMAVLSDGPTVARAVATACAMQPGLLSHYRSDLAYRTKVWSLASAHHDCLVLPEGQAREALEPLPLGVLPLAEEDVRFFTHLGVTRLGTLASLPQASLGMRLGERRPKVLSLLAGHDPERLTAYVPPAQVEERMVLEYGLSSPEALVFVLKTLTDRLCARLRGRGVASQQFDLGLLLDEAVLGGAGKRWVHHALVLPRPVQKSADLLRVLRAKVEALQRDLQRPLAHSERGRTAGGESSWTPDFALLELSLAARELSANHGTPLSLLDPVSQDAGARDQLVAELVAEFGPSAVGLLREADEWNLSDRQVLEPYMGSSGSSGPAGETPGSKRRRLKREAHSAALTHWPHEAPLPTRLVVEAMPVPSQVTLEPLRFLFRAEAVKWWEKAGPQRIDYVAAKVGVQVKRQERAGRQEIRRNDSESRLACVRIMRTEARNEGRPDAGRNEAARRERAEIIGWFD